MSLMDLFANPETFGQLTMSEKLAGAGITALIGMGITFLILILLWICIAVMNKLLNGGKKEAKKAEIASAPVATAPAPVVTPAAEEPATSDDSLIAVIAAAIAAYEGETAAPDFVVKKIRRVSGQTTTWANAGRNECIDSRKI